ncbi:30S ribosomal protein S1 [Clostridium fermenticellae]|uniref:30S ribosomal protein S1 n=1 Tax=Clostridium fermenticellae TaxID=2068654 RepID=A0A386H305_9CLOT|nr:30S ribosomal protein S1 [Clostridium fermenticellae]AYD39958.1 30S ribosomal protein S1 [Clostridium fermenticellae]
MAGEKDNISMNEFIDQIENSMNTIKANEIVKGKVISVSEDGAVINIGYMSDAFLPKAEMGDDQDVNPHEILHENDEIYVYVIKMNDGEGNVLVSKKAADKIGALNKLKAAFNNNSIIDLTIFRAVKGGVVGFINGIRTFMPASQISVTYTKDLNSVVGTTVKVKIIEFNEENEKIVVSHKKIEQEELEIKKEELLNSIKVGEKREGVVVRLTNFGAFVDLGGLDGLIHLSELSWKRVKKASDMVSVGDRVQVYVIGLDKDKNRISLSLKDVNDNPWNNVAGKFKAGNIVEGTVSKIVDFGAFVEITDGIEGLVHLSQISDERVLKVSDVLKVGDKVKVKILDIDNENDRISLSIKEAQGKTQGDLGKYVDKEQANTSLADLLKDFKFED